MCGKTKANQQSPTEAKMYILKLLLRTSAEANKHNPQVKTHINRFGKQYP